MFGNNLVAAAIVLLTASPTLAGSAYVQQIGSNNTPRSFATTQSEVSLDRVMSDVSNSVDYL